MNNLAPKPQARKRRGFLRAVSLKKSRENRVRKIMLVKKYGPDWKKGHTCEKCFAWTYKPQPHEPMPRSALGSITDPENVRLVCGECHTRIHAYPTESYASGWLKRACLLLFILASISTARAADCATGITENTSHVIIDSTRVANSGLLAGDRILAIWQDAGGGLWCAGQSLPYVPATGIAVTIWMDDPLVNDERDWPFGTSISLLVERGGLWFETLAVADAAPPPFPNLGPQPWPHAGTEQIFWLSEFTVLITTAVEGPGAVSAYPYPNPSSGVVRLPFATSRWSAYGLLGRRVATGIGSRVDLSHLPRGVYALRYGGNTHLITLQ